MKYTLEFNSNYEQSADANVFLIRNGDCIGSVDQAQSLWEATINAPYDPDSDSDSRLIGVYKTQGEAINALWDERETAA